MTVLLSDAESLRLRLQDPSLSDETCNTYIASASDLVSAVLGGIDYVAGDVVVVSGGRRSLRLPHVHPVIDGSHVLVVEGSSGDGNFVTFVEGESFYRVGQLLHMFKPSLYGSVARTSRFIDHRFPVGRIPGVWPEVVRLTYSHGWADAADVPAGIRTVALDAAATMATNPQGLRSRQVGGMTDVWASETIDGSSGVLDTIKAKLALLGFISKPGVFSIEV